MHKRVIFQDIDGVLNTREYMHKVDDYEVMDPVNVARMRAVVEKTGAQLVISSAWRISNDWEERIRRVMAESGWVNPPIIGRTPGDHSRGAEINTWLRENPTEDFVIVDDDVWDMLPEQASHIVECDEKIGFSEVNQKQIEDRWMPLP
ncbi:MAG: HAD domain-containing protein [Patescibacteria group bacterium]